MADLGPNVVIGGDNNFEEVVIEASRSQPILVDFWAPWCGPCRTLTPLLERIALEREGAFTLVKVNTDENPGLSQHFQIRTIPTVVAIKEGEIVEQFMGAQTKPYIDALLDRLSPNAKPSPVQEARQLFDCGSFEEAVDAYRRALAQGSSESEVLLGLGRALLEMGEIESAEETLREVEMGEVGYDEAQGLIGVAGLYRLAAASPSAEELERAISEDPNNHSARYALASVLFRDGATEAAMDALLEIINRDKGWEDEAPRKAMLAIFQRIGNRSPLSDAYRSRLSRALY